MCFAINNLIAIFLINEPRVLVKLAENSLTEPDLNLVRAESTT